MDEASSEPLHHVCCTKRHSQVPCASDLVVFGSATKSAFATELQMNIGEDLDELSAFMAS